jgi:hypothetical protein
MLTEKLLVLKFPFTIWSGIWFLTCLFVVNNFTSLHVVLEASGLCDCCQKRTGKFKQHISSIFLIRNSRKPGCPLSVQSYLNTAPLSLVWLCWTWRWGLGERKMGKFIGSQRWSYKSTLELMPPIQEALLSP